MKNKRRRTQRIQGYTAPTNTEPEKIPRISYGVYKDHFEPYLRFLEIDRIRKGGKACTTEFSSQKLFSPEVENSMIAGLEAVSPDWNSNTLFPYISCMIISSATGTRLAQPNVASEADESTPVVRRDKLRWQTAAVWAERYAYASSLPSHSLASRAILRTNGRPTSHTLVVRLSNNPRVPVHLVHDHVFASKRTCGIAPTVSLVSSSLF